MIGSTVAFGRGAGSGIEEGGHRVRLAHANRTPLYTLLR